MASQTSVSVKEKPKRRWITVVAISIAVVLLVLSILPGWLSGRWVSEAEELLAAGEFDRAEIKARSALVFQEENTRALRVLIEISTGTNNAEAIQLSHRLMETGRAEFEDGVRFAELAQAVGDIEGARPVVERLTAERPTDAEVVLLEARQAALDGNGDLALLKVEDALSLDPEMLKAKLLRGLLLSRSTDPVRRLQGKDGLVDATDSDKRVGIDALIALLSSDNLNVYPDERRFLADRLFDHPKAGVSEKLMALQNLIISDPEARAGYVDRAESLFADRTDSPLLVRWLIAVGEAERALEQIPEDIGADRVYFDARISALMRLGRYQEVTEYVKNDSDFLSDLEKASIQFYLESSGDDAAAKEALWEDIHRLAKAENRPDVLLGLAQQAQAKGQIDRSIECYRSAIEIGLGDRESLPLWQQYFLVTLNQPDLELSRQVAEQIVERYPGEASSKNNLAYLNLLLNKDVVGALDMIQALVDAYPEVPGFRTTLALAFLKTGAADKAWSALDTDVIDWSEEDASSRIIVALVAQEVGRSAFAADYLIDIDPGEILPAERDLLEQIK
jgi:tetratricopeptide (TPR) repeat protein